MDGLRLPFFYGANSAYRFGATDPWFGASETIQRIRDACVDDGLFPIHADARLLPFAEEFFDAIVCVDSFNMPDGWQRWLDWHRVVAPDNAAEIKALEADCCRYLGYARMVGRRSQIPLEEQIVSMPQQYTKKPLLRRCGVGSVHPERVSKAWLRKERVKG